MYHVLVASLAAAIRTLPPCPAHADHPAGTAFSSHDVAARAEAYVADFSPLASQHEAADLAWLVSSLGAELAHAQAKAS